MQFHPGRLGFHWDVVKGDVTFLLLGAVSTVCGGAVVAAVVALVRFVRNRNRSDTILLAPIIYAVAILALLVLAYVTRSQPVWLPRYGLIFLAIGLPLFAWALQWAMARTRMRLLKAVLLFCVLAGCITDMNKQLPTLKKVVDDFRAHQRLAALLVSALDQAPAGVRCFSDDVAVRVLSGLPKKDFLRSAFVPAGASANRTDFLEYLREQNAAYLVFFPTEDSLPVKFFPELSSNDKPSVGNFELMGFEHSPFGPDIWLYRIR
jgi:hypothetical protein